MAAPAIEYPPAPVHQKELAELVSVTAHPSSILRARGEAERAAGVEDFVADLRSVVSWLSKK